MDCLTKPDPQGHLLLHKPSQEPLLLRYLEEIGHFTMGRADESLMQP